MKTDSRKIFFLAGLTLYTTLAVSQTVTSVRNGAWDDPVTWSGGIVPTSANATGVVVDHMVELTAASNIATYRLIIRNNLILRAGSVLSILADALPGIPDLQVTGTLMSEDGSALNGTSPANTLFEAGATYIHRQGPLGFIPYATWDANSTFRISGFTTSGYINIAHSDSWKQAFGNVVYDCPLQTIFVVDLNGYLRNIAGDFVIRNTNNQVLRLSTTQNPTINIGGNLRVEGPSEVWFSTNGTGTAINIGKDFSYLSTSTGPTYLTTRGAMVLAIDGNAEVNAAGPIRMASGAADSSGVRQSTVALAGNLSVTTGTFIAPLSGSGVGRVIFRGNAIQNVATSPTGSSFQGNMEYTIETGATVELGESVLSSAAGSLLVKGKLVLGSTDPGGAMQLISKGNIHVPGPRTFDAGSVVEYKALTAQWAGPGHPTSAGVSLVCNNAVMVTLLQDVTTGDFNLIRGSVRGGPFGVRVHGNLTLQAGTAFQVPFVTLAGSNDQRISVNGQAMQDIVIDKSEGSSVNLTDPLSLAGELTILSAGTTVTSNGNLTLISLSDASTGTASVGALPAGSVVVGDVTVQRYMSGEGRIYRYLSSPVENATVASLMDDFPVTGTFPDASTGPGINTAAPSLYWYDESVGGLQQGWTPYPTAGLAADNPLEKGRGYAAFIRKGTGPTVLDFTGPLNQGTLALPTAFTPDMAPSNGWNLVGNPYASAIAWDAAGTGGWTKVNISPVISIRDNGSGGFHRYWDGDINYDDIPGGRVAQGQAFWVRATAPDPSLIIREGVKVSGDAAFYRKAAARIPSFSLTLIKDGAMDKAYFKVRPDASDGIDRWDAVKMDNELFDLSIGDTEVPLAINARDVLPCGEEVVPLRVADLGAGSYSLALSAKYDLRSFDYTCLDHYLNTSTGLAPEAPLNFEVTDDPASASSNRFSLHLKEITPIDTVSIHYPPVICAGDEIPVVIAAAQQGIHYSVRGLSGKVITEESDGDAETVSLLVKTDSLPPGNYVWEISARAVCRKVRLRKQIAVKVVAPPAIEGWADNGCKGEGVMLNVSSAQTPLTVTWFESPDANDTLATGLSWITPPLQKSKVYYASGSLTQGCNSDRIPVKAEVAAYDPAVISRPDEMTLASNYQDGNEWYSGDRSLTDSGRIFRPDRNGRYILKVTVSGCYTADTVDFFRNPDEAGFYAYPNPTSGLLHVRGGKDVPVSIGVWNALGEFVQSIQLKDPGEAEGSGIDTNPLSAGIYFLHVIGRTTSTIIRLIKTPD